MEQTLQNRTLAQVFLPRPPPYLASHDPDALSFPDAPTTELPPIQPSHARHDAGNEQLPPLSAVTGCQSQSRFAAAPSPAAASEQPFQPLRVPVSPWPTGNPLSAHYLPSYVQQGESPPPLSPLRGMGAIANSPSAASATSAASAASPAAHYGGVNINDPQIREVVEALQGLATGATPLTPSTASLQEEPLFSVLASSYPVLGRVSEATMSIYTNYSPQAIKSGVGIVEGIVTPISSYVNKVTGAERRLRRLIHSSSQRPQRHRRPSPDPETSRDISHKKRRVDGDASRSPDPDLFRSPFTAERRPSTSTIGSAPPSYDEKSPAYTSTDTYTAVDARGHSSSGSWPSVVTPSSMIGWAPPSYEEKSPAYVSADVSAAVDAQVHASGGGLWPSVATPSRVFGRTASALSLQASAHGRQALRFVLGHLSQATDRITQSVDALKSALDELDRADEEAARGRVEFGETGEWQDASTGQERQHAPQTLREIALGEIAARVTEITARVTALKDDVANTLLTALQTVTRYAYPVLPADAKDFVSRHLQSLQEQYQARREAPQSAAGRRQTGQTGTQRLARQVLDLAKVGLNVLDKVTRTLARAAHNAEESYAQPAGPAEAAEAAVAETYGYDRKEKEEPAGPWPEPLVSGVADRDTEGDIMMREQQ